MDYIIYIIIGVAALVVGALLGVLIGIALRKRFAEAKIGSAESEAERLIEEGAYLPKYDTATF